MYFWKIKFSIKNCYDLMQLILREMRITKVSVVVVYSMEKVTAHEKF